MMWQGEREAMKASRTKAPPPTEEISGSDRALLVSAYKAGLIAGWKHDRERGYCLSLGNHRDEYVEVTHLSGYLDKLRRGAF
jgi:hypothetical protein